MKFDKQEFFNRCEFTEHGLGEGESSKSLAISLAVNTKFKN